MARKNTQVNIELSPEDEKLAILLSSITSANNELEATGQINKKVLAEIESNKKSLVELKITKDSLYTEVSKIEQDTKKSKNLLNLIKDDIANININKNNAEKDLIDFEKISEIKKEELQSEIKLLKDKIENIKLDINNCTKISKIELEKLDKEITILNNSISILLKEEISQKEKNNNLIDICAELSKKREIFINDNKIIDDEIFKKQEFLKNLESEIYKNNESINNQKKEIQENDNIIILKKEEYKKQETRLFTIKDREFALDQREKFIKSQFERAHVKWEE